MVLTARKNQQASFCARVLDCRAQQRVDQLRQDDLTRNRFGHLDHSREVEVLDGCLYCRGRIRDRSPCSDLRVKLLELSNLAIRSPPEVAVARLAEVGRRN